MLLETLIPALLPVVADGARGLFNKLTGGAGAKPANVGEVLQLMDADTNRMEALAKIDAPGNVSQWVANIRAMQRPVASLLVISGYLGAIVASADDAIVAQLGTYAQMVTFYLFGDRTYMHFRQGSK